jgi:ribonuclease H2 subunit A
VFQRSPQPGIVSASNMDDDKIPKEPSSHIFIPPSVDPTRLLSGESYTYYSLQPSTIPLSSTETPPLSSSESQVTPCVLGVDEAGRGPVLGPMVYSAFYLPQHLHHSLLTRDHSFNDSKVLTPGIRSNLMKLICMPGHPLFNSCGWAVKVLSARDISSGMMRPGAGVYNLNAQAMDATVEIIRGILEKGTINIGEVYIDTIGNPATYQQRLERIFPSLKITVAKKADALYPCVSAASVVAKVTRDAALETCYAAVVKDKQSATPETGAGTQAYADSWGSGYPSDSKCVRWLRNNMDPIFGWGGDCRFSWGTAKELLEGKEAVRVEWPAEGDEEDEGMRLTNYFGSNAGKTEIDNELRDWFGYKCQSAF